MIYFLLAIFTVLQILDGVSTYRALMLPGTVEGNPAMKWLFGHVGTALTLVVVKTFAVVALSFLCYTFKDRWEMSLLLVAVCAFYGYIVGHNFSLN